MAKVALCTSSLHLSSGAMVLLEPRFQSVLASLSLRSIWRSLMLHSLCMAMARVIKDRFSRLSTWYVVILHQSILAFEFDGVRPSFGTSQQFSSAKTISMAWERLQNVAPPTPSISLVGTKSLVFRYVYLVEHAIVILKYFRRSMVWISLRPFKP